MKKWFENKGEQYRSRENATSNKAKNLFWLNFRSIIYKFCGSFFMIAGLIASMFNWIVAIILIALSIFLYIKGHQRRLEYKLRSGYIVYNG